VRKAKLRFRLGGGVKKKLVQRVHLPTGSRLVSHDQRGYTARKLSPRADRRLANRPVKWKPKSLSLKVNQSVPEKEVKKLLQRTQNAAETEVKRILEVSYRRHYIRQLHEEDSLWTEIGHPFVASESSWSRTAQADPHFLHLLQRRI